MDVFICIPGNSGDAEEVGNDFAQSLLSERVSSRMAGLDRRGPPPGRALKYVQSTRVSTDN